MIPSRIYICGPYSLGDIPANVACVLDAATVLLDAGCAPYVPHLTHYWHLKHPRRYETWLALDLVWLACCDALLRLPGESYGADGEVAYAQETLKIPAFFTLEDTLGWHRARQTA